MTTPKNIRKMALPAIAIVILTLLVGGVFYTLTSMKNVFQGVVGEVQGEQGIVVKFNLQKAVDLGIVTDL